MTRVDDPRQMILIGPELGEGDSSLTSWAEIEGRLRTDDQALAVGGIAVNRLVRAEGLLETIKAESESRKAEGFTISAPAGAFNSPRIVSRYDYDQEKVDRMVLDTQIKSEKMENEARQRFAKATGYLALREFYKDGQSEESKRILEQLGQSFEADFARFKGKFYLSPRAKSDRPAFVRRLKKQVNALSNQPNSLQPGRR